MDLRNKEGIKPSKRYVDDQKVQEHYAIIPTKTFPTAEAFQYASQACD